MKASTNIHGSTARSDIVAGILVGGHSTRMGTPKALLPHPAGATILEYLVHVSTGVAETVVILGSLDRLPKSMIAVRRLDDRFPGDGPLAGLESLLAYAESGWCLLIGCDLPCVDEELLKDITSQFDNGCDAVAFAAGDSRRMHHPCCAGYHGRMLGTVREKLSAGQLRMQSLLADVRTRTLTPNVQQCERLLNANTPEDLRTLWSKYTCSAGSSRSGPLPEKASSKPARCNHDALEQR